MLVQDRRTVQLSIRDGLKLSGDEPSLTNWRWWVPEYHVGHTE